MSGPGPRVARGESLQHQVARNIRNQIAAGVLRHGQPLPSTRDLAEQWNVSTFTIDKAMQILATEGAVVSKPRAGRVINAPDQGVRHEVRSDTPSVLLIGGFAGSGKTELGRILARQTGWPMLDKDTLTRPVVEAALEILGLSPNDRESEEYVTRIRPREYEALANAVSENVQCGTSVIATAPFIREFGDLAWIKRMEAACADMNAKLFIVWVACDAGTMHTYIRHRGAARDAYKLDNWESYIDSINVDFKPPVPHFTVDNSASGAPLQEQARELIRSTVIGG
ncbi:MAG: GntR family transcriptional regulator [Saccharothrix sp.]|nr:GntR family transcriptional regulator [Saccharothrix sp.]